MQVASRFVLVWGVLYPFPHLAAHQAYSTMLLAWSATEVVRYTFFALSLSGVNWDWFTRFRYSTFLPLYPLGIGSECVLIWNAIATPAASELHPWYPAFLTAVLATYVPGSYILYTHMLSQRRKVLARLG
jgi:very-long-chain (3R)-3-hydroxyacyl-CoA dehydratase